MTVGVLSVQGAFLEHEQMLQKLNCDSIEIRKKEDLRTPIDGLILPGGESTVQGRLLRDLGLFDPLKEMISSDLPVLATCAGMILLADQLANDDKRYFRSIPMTVKRNAYGRQLGSFSTTAEFDGLGEIPMTFIRAPYVESVGPDVQILASVQGKTVAVQYRNQIALSFHPELNDDLRVHRKFLSLIPGPALSGPSV